MPRFRCIGNNISQFRSKIPYSLPVPSTLQPPLDTHNAPPHGNRNPNPLHKTRQLHRALPKPPPRPPFLQHLPLHRRKPRPPRIPAPRLPRILRPSLHRQPRNLNSPPQSPFPRNMSRKIYKDREVPDAYYGIGYYSAACTV
jgi:hypothetical protein